MYNRSGRESRGFQVIAIIASSSHLDTSGPRPLPSFELAQHHHHRHPHGQHQHQRHGYPHRQHYCDFNTVNTTDTFFTVNLWQNHDSTYITVSILMITSYRTRHYGHHGHCHYICQYFQLLQSPKMGLCN